MVANPGAVALDGISPAERDPALDAKPFVAPPGAA
jgi:hypothetical protein